MSVEKNDVDISSLFHWGEKFTIQGKKKVTVYMRLVGDAELNRSRVYALRKSAELREALKTEGSDMRRAFIPNKSDFDKAKLTELIIIYSMRDISRVAMDSVQLAYPKEPSADSSLEKLEQYQKEVDAYPKKKEAEIRKAIEKEMTKRRKELSGVEEDRLFDVLETSLIAELCEKEALSSFNEMCTYFGSFKDENYKERLFESFDSFDNLPTDIKKQFIEFYSSLEIGTEDLKKLPEATQ